MEVSSYELEVRALASNQVNTGVFLPNTKVSLPPDTYSFDVHINDLNQWYCICCGARFSYAYHNGKNSAEHTSPDTYSFDVHINDLNYEFQYSIKEGETNRSVQNRLAKLIRIINGKTV